MGTGAFEEVAVIQNPVQLLVYLRRILGSTLKYTLEKMLLLSLWWKLLVLTQWTVRGEWKPEKHLPAACMRSAGGRGCSCQGHEGHPGVHANSTLSDEKYLWPFAGWWEKGISLLPQKQWQNEQKIIVPSLKHASFWTFLETCDLACFVFLGYRLCLGRPQKGIEYAAFVKDIIWRNT